VLILEDLHWADRSTRDLVTFLARNLDREALLIILTIRGEEVSRGHPIGAWMASLERDLHTSRLELPAFSRDDVARQVETLLGSPATDFVIARIHGRADGNPFFVEELVAAEQRGESAALPRTLAETLGGQITALPDETQRLLGLVAVAGRPIDERLVASVGERAETDVRGPIRAAGTARGVGPHR